MAELVGLGLWSHFCLEDDVIFVKQPLLLALALTLGSHGLNAGDLIAPLPLRPSCKDIVTGSSRNMAKVSQGTINSLRALLAKVFLNSDDVFRQYYQRNPLMPTQLSPMGSTVSVNSYGIYELQLPGQGGKSVMKVPLKYSTEELFGYFYDNVPLPQRIDPSDFYRRSRAAVESRRTSGFGILLLHFFKLMEEKTGIKVAATLQDYYSSNQLKGLLTGNLRLSDDRRRVFTGEEEERQIPEDALPSFGIVTEKLNLDAEARDDATKPEEEQFKNLPGVKEQVLWIASLLNQLGIELLDPNPVLGKNGRVYLLDLEASAVVLNINGQTRILFGVFSESDRKLVQAKLENRNLHNELLLGKGGLSRKDLNENAQENPNP